MVIFQCFTAGDKSMQQFISLQVHEGVMEESIWIGDANVTHVKNFAIKHIISIYCFAPKLYFFAHQLAIFAIAFYLTHAFGKEEMKKRERGSETGCELGSPNCRCCKMLFTKLTM